MVQPSLLCTKCVINSQFIMHKINSHRYACPGAKKGMHAVLNGDAIQTLDNGQTNILAKLACPINNY